MTVNAGDISRGASATTPNWDSAPTQRNTGSSDQGSITELSRQVADLKIKVQQMEEELRSATLGNSSIEDGSVKVYDRSGEVRQTVGRQNDGSFAVTYANGVKPPKPTPPICAAAELSIVVYWDGLLENNTPKPADMARVDIHISDQADFAPNPNTLYGSLFGESAQTIPMSVVQLYVKLVSVTNADVISDPSTTVPVKPAAARNIEAKSIGAEQLKSNIILSSTIYAGDPDSGEYVKMTPSGLYVFDSTNTIRALFQGEDVMVSGEIRSADAGERVVINEADVGDPSVRFYPDNGINFAEIRSDTDHLNSNDQDVANLFLRTPGTWQSRAANIENIVQANYPEPNIGYRRILQGFSYADGTPNEYSLMEHVQWGTDGDILLRNNKKDIGLLFGNRCIYFTNSDGTNLPSGYVNRTTLYARAIDAAGDGTGQGVAIGPSSNGRPFISFYGQGVGMVADGGIVYVVPSNNPLGANDFGARLVFCNALICRYADGRADWGNDGAFHARNKANTIYVGMRSSNFETNTPSWRVLKKNFVSLTDYLGKSPLDIMRDIDVSAWEYDEEKIPKLADGKQHIGVMFDELPDKLVTGKKTKDADDESAYSTGDLLMVTMKALQDLVSEVDYLKGMISPVTDN